MDLPLAKEEFTDKQKCPLQGNVSYRMVAQAGIELAIHGSAGVSFSK
jgi:hypothetical protein